MKVISYFFLVLLFIINIILVIYIMQLKSNSLPYSDNQKYIYPYSCTYCESRNDISSTVQGVRNFMLKLSPRLCPSAADAMSYSIVLSSVKIGVNPLYAASVSFVESGFNPAAVSSAGASGLFQVMKFNKVNKGYVDFGINSESGVDVLKKCLNRTNNNCIEAYICYIYGENGYKTKVNDTDIPPTVAKLSTILMTNKIYDCGNFAYY